MSVSVECLVWNFVALPPYLLSGVHSGYFSGFEAQTAMIWAAVAIARRTFTIGPKQPGSSISMFCCFIQKCVPTA